MTDLARDSRHREAADAMPATGFKGVKSKDQPESGFLHEIVAFTGSVVQQTVGTEMGQSEVHQDRLIPVLDLSGYSSSAFMTSLTFELPVNCCRIRSGGHQ